MITPDMIAHIPLFAQLSPEQQAQIAERAADIQLQEGQWLIQEGEPPSFFVLLAGSLDVVKNLNDVEQIINRYNPGDSFGELPLLLGTTAVASLRAHEPSQVLRLEPVDFQALILGIPALSHELLMTMARRVGHLQQLSIESTPASIQVVGNRWDPACHDLRDFLARNRVAFEWLEPTDPAAQDYLLQASGTATDCPLVVLQDGSLLITPSRREVAERLGIQTTPGTEIYDVAILGAGPAGLAAAVYGASEGLKTLLIDREAPGGQAGTSSRIENYLGFPAGLSGEELSRRAWQQARRFGAELLIARNVKGIDLESMPRAVILDDDERVDARAIVIATGVSWRRHTAQGLDSLVGRGVYYGAARTEGQGTHGKDVCLIGGGNSAGQAALYFANYARSVTLLVRGDMLETTMSQYLIEQLAVKDNIVVRLRCEVVATHGKEHLEAIEVQDHGLQAKQTLPQMHYLSLLGQMPKTEWLPQIILRDERGYLLTGRDVLIDDLAMGSWPLPRDPYLLETSVPGVFAAGDVRHGSIKRVASSVGEGSMSIAFIHQYLAD